MFVKQWKRGKSVKIITFNDERTGCNRCVFRVRKLKSGVKITLLSTSIPDRYHTPLQINVSQYKEIIIDIKQSMKYKFGNDKTPIFAL